MNSTNLEEIYQELIKDIFEIPQPFEMMPLDSQKVNFFT